MCIVFLPKPSLNLFTLSLDNFKAGQYAPVDPNLFTPLSPAGIESLFKANSFSPNTPVNLFSPAAGAGSQNAVFNIKELESVSALNPSNPVEKEAFFRFFASNKFRLGMMALSVVIDAGMITIAVIKDGGKFGEKSTIQLGSIVGNKIGATIGMCLGSILCPGIGTSILGVIGGLIGNFVGRFTGECLFSLFTKTKSPSGLLFPEYLSFTFGNWYDKIDFALCLGPRPLTFSNQVSSQKLPFSSNANASSSSKSSSKSVSFSTVYMEDVVYTKVDRQDTPQEPAEEELSIHFYTIFSNLSHGDQDHQLMRFTVPSRMELLFFIPHGQPLMTRTYFEHLYPQLTFHPYNMTHNQTCMRTIRSLAKRNGDIYSPGSACPDYQLQLVTDAEWENIRIENNIPPHIPLNPGLFRRFPVLTDFTAYIFGHQGTTSVSAVVDYIDSVQNPYEFSILLFFCCRA